LPVVTIEADYDGYVDDGTTKDSVQDVDETLWVGYVYKLTYPRFRAFFRFPLTDLPLGVTVTQVRFLFYVWEGNGAHLMDIHAYDTNGQTDPEPDNAPTTYARCASGNLYNDDLTEQRTVGAKAIVLGGTANADVENAKATVNRFSLGLHEEGDNDAIIQIEPEEDWVAPDKRPKLEITYEIPPVVGYQYSDGLVTVRVG